MIHAYYGEIEEGKEHYRINGDKSELEEYLKTLEENEKYKLEIQDPVSKAHNTYTARFYVSLVPAMSEK